MNTYTKICTKCNVSKSYIEFTKDKRAKDGLGSECKLCNKKNYYENTEKERNRKKVYLSENKEKLKDYYDQYYEKNRNSKLEKCKEYREENKDLIRERGKLYYVSNKDSIKKQRDKRKSNDPLFKLICNTRTLILTVIKNNGYSKKSRTYKILGCTFEEFKYHIENQFSEGMSWDNRHEWHLDHITPVSWGKTEEEIIALNHYTNFQPLWAEDNLKKGNRFCG